MISLLAHALFRAHAPIASWVALNTTVSTNQFNELVLSANDYTFGSAIIVRAGHTLKLSGMGLEATRLEACSRGGRYFVVEPFGVLTLQNMALDNCRTKPQSHAAFGYGRGVFGGEIFSEGHLTLDNCSFSRNAVVYDVSNQVPTPSSVRRNLSSRFTLLTVCTTHFPGDCSRGCNIHPERQFRSN